MARPTRIQTPGLIRHVMSRGNGRMRIFLDDEDFRQFTYILGDVVEDFRVECWNYCLMPNHYHATLQPTEPNLSEAIRRLNSVYGLWWNKRHAKVGHVFQGRFKAQIIQDDAYLLSVSRYVVLNPVRAALCERPEHWTWSSYRATVGLTASPAFLTSASTLRQFGEAAEHVLQNRFMDFVAGPPEDPSVMDRLRSNERVLGDRAFKAAVNTSGTGGRAAEVMGFA